MESVESGRVKSAGAEPGLPALRVLLSQAAEEDASRCEFELRAYNPQVELRRSGSQETFLAALKEFRPDVILVDPGHPVVPGAWALEAALRELPEAAVIFISEPAGEADAVRPLKAGAADFLVKGDLARLAPAVQDALRHAREKARRAREEAKLRESEERYALALQGASDGIWDWNLATAQLYFSPRWKEMLGYEDGEVGTSPDEWFRRIHPEDLGKVRSELAIHLAGESPSFNSEHRMRHKTKGYRWVLSRGVAIRGHDGEVFRIVGSQSDINSRKLAEEQLLHDAFHDPLTGLPNRALLLDRLSQRIRRLGRDAQPFAVLFLDLDRFKLVNDSLGHALGDELLREVGRRLERSVRPSDTVARLGGDEFAVLLDQVRNADQARQIVERIQRGLKIPLDLGAQEVFTTASIGVALGTDAAARPEDLLRDADTAMYRAKSLGRDRYAVFDAAMRDQVVRTLSVDAELRRALERSELEVYYQPIIDLVAGTLAGFESLARWRHPTRGILPPSEFIPVAEETGLIIALDRWIIREACRQMHAWQAESPTADGLYVSVNLSAKQFLQSDVCGFIRGVLVDTCLPNDCLSVEITESALMADRDSAARVLAELRDYGVRCYLDDFGTGYSSMAYLHRLPVDALKIDKSFVMAMGAKGEGDEIVRTITTLGRNLGKKVIAEGVETPRHVEGLKALGCDFGQGYHFSRPVSKEGAVKLITSGRTWS